MFLDFFYGLRDEGVPVSIQEWQMLMTALEKGLHGSSLLGFYNLAKACLVKSETYFDGFDRAFARVFRGVEGQLFADAELILQVLEHPQVVERVDLAGDVQCERAHARPAGRFVS